MLQLFAAVGFFVLPAAWIRTRRQIQGLPDLTPPAPALPWAVLLAWAALPPLAAFGLEQISWYWREGLSAWPVLADWWTAEAEQATRIQTLLDAPLLVDQWGVALVLVPVAALGEEFFFRGTLLPLWKEAYGKRMALLFSTLLFAAAHLSLSQLPFLLGAGLLLGLAYAQTQQLWVPMAAHFAHNGLTLLVAKLSPTAEYGFADQPPHSAGLIVGTALICAALGVFLHRAHRSHPEQPSSSTAEE
jgi:membrane protease YdiL (CAAX protease family)